MGCGCKKTAAAVTPAVEVQPTEVPSVQPTAQPEAQPATDDTLSNYFLVNNLVEMKSE